MASFATLRALRFHSKQTNKQTNKHEFATHFSKAAQAQQLDRLF
jgi:hypothetical protein